MITADQLRQYESAGVIAAARGLHLHTTTVHRLADQLGVEFKTCTKVEQERRERERASIAEQVKPLAAARLTQREICVRLGVTRAILRRAAEEHNIDINSRAP